MGYSVGLKVLAGIGFLVLLMLGLLAPNMHGEEDEYVSEEDDV